MDNKVFINNAFNKAMNDYLNGEKNPEGIMFNSFYSVVIRLLTCIYDATDIINPFYAMDEDSFINTLKKYGYHIDDILKFRDAFEKYYNNETNEGFVFIQKCIIDMFMAKRKKVDISISNIKTFKYLLYSTISNNPYRVAYNFKMSRYPNEVLSYFNNELVKNVVNKYSSSKEVLSMEAYELLGYSIDDIHKMKAREVDEVNKKIYNYLNVDEDAINKDYLLNEALLKENKRRKKLQATHGYINIVFIISLIILGAIGLVLITLAIV